MLDEQENHQVEEQYWDVLEEAESYVIDALAETMDLYGITPSIGRLYGVLYFSEEPMTLNHMSQSMGMSKPSMSTGINSLMDMEVVQKVWRKGERKDLYVAEKDFFKFFTVFFCKKWEREISVNMDAIKKATVKLTGLLNDNVPEDVRKKAKADLKQLEDSIAYYTWLKNLVHALKSGNLHFFEKNLKE